MRWRPILPARSVQRQQRVQGRPDLARIDDLSYLAAPLCQPPAHPPHLAAEVARAPRQPRFGRSRGQRHRGRGQQRVAVARKPRTAGGEAAGPLRAQGHRLEGDQVRPRTHLRDRAAQPAPHLVLAPGQAQDVHAVGDLGAEEAHVDAPAGPVAGEPRRQRDQLLAVAQRNDPQLAARGRQMLPPGEHPARGAQRQRLRDGQRVPRRRERAGRGEIVDHLDLEHVAHAGEPTLAAAPLRRTSASRSSQLAV